MRCSANPAGGLRALAVGLGIAVLTSACTSLQSVPYAAKAYSDSRPDVAKEQACDRAFDRMIQSPDPIERRRWEIYREDLDCPQRSVDAVGNS